MGVNICKYVIGFNYSAQKFHLDTSGLTPYRFQPAVAMGLAVKKNPNQPGLIRIWVCPVDQ
jgi:hypothetical protein